MNEQAPNSAPVIRDVFPYLCVRDAAAAIDFYTRVFGARETFRIDGPGSRIGHAQLTLGPVTLMLLPSAAVVATVMHRTSTRVFARHGLHATRDFPALVAYTLGYSFILQPVSFGGYVVELLGARKTWGTK